MSHFAKGVLFGLLVIALTLGIALMWTALTSVHHCAPIPTISPAGEGVGA